MRAGGLTPGGRDRRALDPVPCQYSSHEAGRFHILDKNDT